MTDVKPDIERIGVTRRSLGTIYRNMSGLLIAGIIGAIITIVLAIWGVQISGFDPAQQSLGDRLLPPFTDGHIAGTDQLGRDVFARVSVGFRWSVPVGIFSGFSVGSWGKTLCVFRLHPFRHRLFFRRIYDWTVDSDNNLLVVAVPCLKERGG